MNMEIAEGQATSVLLGNAVVGQSGGPTAAINATLAGVIRGVLNGKKQRGWPIGTLYGMRNGVEGLLCGNLVNLNAHFDPAQGGCEEALDTLALTPAAALGSCRRRLPAKDSDQWEPVMGQLLDRLKQNHIRYFFYIGGNDSMDTVEKLSAYAQSQGYDMRVVGVPKTIDNDLMGTDHTPGYGSAAKYIAVTMGEILRDAAVYTLPAVTVVEIMGRDAGWLTAAASLGRLVSGQEPDLVYLPERIFDLEAFYEDVAAALARHPSVVVAVSEGLRCADGSYVGACAQSGSVDAFGHQYLAGTGKALELAIRERFGCKVRSVELNLPQRCAAHLLSAQDVEESLAVGAGAVSAAVAGVSQAMMTIQRTEGEEYGYAIGKEPIASIANRTRRVPDAFITPRGNQVTDDCLRYLLPLIQGERYPVYDRGMPRQYIFQ